MTADPDGCASPLEAEDPQGDDLHTEDVDYESTPLARGEYIASLVHLYRGELYRANSWRIRLDNTTNWAVLTTAGLLSLSFGTASHTHWVLLIGMALITVFLFFEARRFRFYDVWRARVRMIEENFYGPILRRDPVSPERDWGALVAEDLLHPRFKISYLAAVRARLTRNYWAIYAVLLLVWTLKVLVHPEPAESWADVTEHMALGVVPWWMAILYLGVFVVSGLAVIVFGPRSPSTEAAFWGQRAEDEQPRLDVIDV